MNTRRIDAVARLFAQRRLTRRAALAAASLAAAGVTTASAQDATSVPVAATPGPGDGDGDGPSFLFVQTFGAGSLAPKEGEDGVLTLTADHLAGQTLYFSDRPDRIVGMMATERFFGSGSGSEEAEGLGFTPADPPNAALVFAKTADDQGSGEVIVVELIDPTYDPATGTAIYDVRVLAGSESVDLTLVEPPLTAAEAPRTFKAASLFIDDWDCQPGFVGCQTAQNKSLGYLQDGDNLQWPFCQESENACCLPCGGRSVADWTDQCNAFYVEECKGTCTAYFWSGSAPTCES